MDTKKQTPSIGRIIHTVRRGGLLGKEHKPAIIEDVAAEDMRATVFVNGSTVAKDLRIAGDYDPTGERIGSWHWPEYVP